MNGVLAPKSIVVEVADLVPLGGRQKFKARYGEHLEMLPGFVPPEHAIKWFHVNKGEPSGSSESL